MKVKKVWGGAHGFPYPFVSLFQNSGSATVSVQRIRHGWLYKTKTIRHPWSNSDWKWGGNLYFFETQCICLYKVWYVFVNTRVVTFTRKVNFKSQAQDIYREADKAVSIAYQLLIRQSNKHCITPGLAIYLTANLSCLSRYGARTYRLRLCLCGGTRRKDTMAADRLTTSILASRESRIATW